MAMDLMQMINHLEGMATEIRDILKYFMLNHSEIESLKPYDEIWCMGPEGNRYYADMDSRGVLLQKFLREQYGLFFNALMEVLYDQPEEVQNKIRMSHTLITRTIEHKLTFCETSAQALNLATEALDGQIKILKHVKETQAG
ncbi:MAG: hypothetical protein AB1346_02930 [Thermodesulfobacteriota bacterium]